MTHKKSVLCASTALPLVLAAAAGVFLPSSRALANCTTAGVTTTCSNTAPNPYTSTIGTGPGFNGRTVEVLNGATVATVNAPAISLGDNATVNVRTGGAVSGNTVSGEGNFGSGPNIVEFNSNGTLLVEQGASIVQTGSNNRSEAVNVHGFGNTLTNYGTISGTGSAALWFEDTTTGTPRNIVDNFGTITRVGGGPVFGTNGGAGIVFRNETGAVVNGSLSFAGGNDDLLFFANSTVTGSINGGGGSNNLTLQGAAGSSDTLAGALANFQTLTKDGLGRWTVSGSLSGFSSTTVNQGTLALTGNNVNYSAGVLVNPLGTLEARAQSLPEQADPADNLTNVTNNGVLRFAQPDAGIYLGQVVGNGRVEKTGAGVLTLAPSAGAGNTYTGTTTINEGTVSVAANDALGAVAGGLILNGGELRTTATFATARPATLLAGGGTFEQAAGTTLTDTGVISNVGRLTKAGGGTLVLGAANTYVGGTQVNGGVLQAGANANLGAAAGSLGLDGGTLRSTAGFTTARSTTLGAGGGTFETQAGTLTHTGTVGGPGALTKTGAGTLVLDGTNSYAGGTAIDGGVLEVDANANLGLPTTPLSFGGGTLHTTASFAMNRATTLNAGGGTFATDAVTQLTEGGAIVGTGALTKAGAGTMVLTGAASHAGGTTIAAGTLQVGNGGAAGSLAGNVVDNAALAFARGDTLDVAGAITGTGTVTQSGGGTTRLLAANGYAGTTTVAAGALYVNGDQSGATGATTAQAGTTLGGSGTIGGNVTIANGATLAPGDVGATPGTLTINGNLGLATGAILTYGFGQANVPGGPLNDLTVVGGDLALDGTLNVTTSPGGSFGPGVYRVFDYGGTLTDNGLTNGTIPSPDFYVQTSVAQQVNLVNTTGLTLNFWDGAAGPRNNGVVNGGDGAWQTSAGNDNWTESTGIANAPFTDGSFAIFQGTPGTVTVDDTLGDVAVSGMQFAVDGYVVQGDAVTLTSASGAVVRVGDGTAAGSGMTATIDAELTGGARLVKTDVGTLVLNAANSYAGGTEVDGGVVQIAADAALGAAGASLGLDAGTLRVTADVSTVRATTLGAGGGTFDTAGADLTHAGVIGGDGTLTKTGNGTLTLTGSNTYAGGTAIEGGVVQAASDANLGDAGGALGIDGGTLTALGSFTMNRATTLGAGGGTIGVGGALSVVQHGDVAGPGALTKTGSGTLTLAGTGTYAGGTAIAGGTLQLGDGGTAGAVTGDVVDEGALVVNRSDELTLGGTISGTGSVEQVGAGTTTLSGTNSYAGGTTISNGALSVAADANLGDAAGALTLDGGTLASSASFGTARATTLGAGGGTFDPAAGTELAHSGTIGGPGGLTKAGDGTLTLTGANGYGGASTVTAGALYVDGDQSAATGPTLANAGILGGSGTIGGDVSVGAATLAPGARGETPGTLTIAGDLALAGGSTLDYSFGAANVVGGPLNDLTVVGGDLTLDGTLNVRTTPGGAFDPGIYRVISYAGALTNNGLAVGTIPSPDFYVQTSVANQVNLVNTAGLTLNWWDGDAGPKNNGVANGGNGTWQSSAGNDNWTESTGAINAPFSDGSFAVFAGAAGTVTVDDSLGGVGVSGMQFLTDGYVVGGDPIALVGGKETVVRTGDGTAASAGITTTIASAMTGDSTLVKTDLGTLVLQGDNSFTGGTAIRGGTLAIASDANLGDAEGGLEFDGGTLSALASLTIGRATSLGAGGGTFDVGGALAVVHTGTIEGGGGLTKAGTGSLTLAGAGSYSGGTTIIAGTLQLGNGGTAGSIPGDVVDNGILAFNRSDKLDVAGLVSGTGEVQQVGTGATRLAGANSYAGATTVSAGALYVNGDQTAASGATTATGGTLGGKGTIGGSVTIADGATLAPGDLGATPGQLNVLGNLGLSGGSTLDYSFGRADVVGGPLNDLTVVGGDLTLDGTLNVLTTPDGSFDPGVYRVISYAGTLTDNGLAIGTIPSPDFSVQTSIAQQVNLINTGGLTLDWWDGDAGPKNDGVANGGSGTWQSSAGNDNWTDTAGTPNAPFADGAFAIFAGASGTVTVDDSVGQVTVSGMQFLTDGYRVQGDAIGLVGPSATIRVGDGTADSALTTATVAADLTGGSQLVKADPGRLVLVGTNTYTGGTRIDGGVLEISREENLGAASGALALDGGTLRTTADMSLARATTLGASGGTFDTTDATLIQTAVIGGAGQLTKSGSGSMVLTAANTWGGGTVVAEGALRVGDGGTTGSLVGDVANEGTLVFDRSNDFDFDGAISGGGALLQQGSGITTLGGTNSFGGTTRVADGTLRAGAAGAFSAASAHVVDASGTLDLAGLDEAVASLSNAGRVSLGDVPGTRLAVTGDYVGQGGVLHLSTELGGDDSPTDRITIGGDASGSGIVEVSNAGGTGAETVDGIKLIDVAGKSKASFTLAGDFELEGRQSIVAGAYAYSLYQGGVDTPGDGDWYLRSGLIEPGGGGGQVQPGVPVYEGYPATLLALNGLPTMQQRIGNRYWSGQGNPASIDAGNGVAVPPDGYAEDKRAWARLDASHGRLEPDVSDNDTPTYDLQTVKLQVGIDRPVKELDDGSLLVGGVTFNYGTVDNDVSSDFGDGKISTTGYGLGGSLTWFQGDGVYFDGQAQVAWYDSDLSSDLVDEKLVSGNDGFGWALGVEGGKRIPINADWTLTPQAQLYYSSVDFDSFDDTFGAGVSMQDGASMPIRVGAAIEKEQAGRSANSGPTRTHLYGIANLYYDLIDQTAVSVDETRFTADNQNLWGSVGVGGSFTWNDGAYGVYTEGLVASSLADFGDNYSNKITIGFRAAW
ncbi:MAG: autotransporter-associated beta strand repeat-containing protein [Amaricoccus sp.]